MLPYPIMHQLPSFRLDTLGSLPDYTWIALNDMALNKGTEEEGLPDNV